MYLYLNYIQCYLHTRNNNNKKQTAIDTTSYDILETTSS